MRLVLLVYQLCLVFRAEAQLPGACITSDTNRAPGQCYLQPPPPLWASFLLSHSSWFPMCPAENSDINVTCGTQYMDLSIYICPVYHALYNESLMVVNNVDKPECYGTAVWNVDPPLLTFRFPINESAIASCNNMFTVFPTTIYSEGALFLEICRFDQLTHVSISNRQSTRPEQGSSPTSPTSSMSTSLVSSTP